MSERKVLNKYYPPDFDPSNIPRCKVARNKTFSVRLMAPCNMKCNTCGEYIAKAKKFNARKEDVDDENYLGLRIYRFYIRCPMCMAEIVFKTDPEHTDYIIEAGATRNFQAQILAERQAKREQEAAEEEEKSNPMKMLENRTKQSRHEMDMIEKLEELKELNQRQAHVDYDTLLSRFSQQQQTQLEKQEEEDEEYIKSVFGRDTNGAAVKRLKDDSDSDEETVRTKLPKPTEAPTDLLAPPTKKPEAATTTVTEKKSWQRSIGTLGGGLKKSSLIVRSTASSTSKLAPLVRAASASASKPVASTAARDVPSSDSSSVSAESTNKVGSSVDDNTVQKEGALEKGSKNSAVGADTTSNGLSGLGLLGAYSDSESD